MKSLRTKAVAEDGVLQMLLWLDRTPESFAPGRAKSPADGTHLPKLPPQQVLRFDTKRLHAALGIQRAQRDLTWRDVAAEVGMGASSLRHLSKGGRVGFPQAMRLTAGLERPAAEFTCASDW